MVKVCSKRHHLEASKGKICFIEIFTYFYSITGICNYAKWEVSLNDSLGESE